MMGALPRQRDHLRGERTPKTATDTAVDTPSPSQSDQSDAQKDVPDMTSMT